MSSSPLVINNRPVLGPDRRAPVESPETLPSCGSALLSQQPSEPDAAPSPGGAHGTAAETGTIKWFNVAKKYGFITPDGGGKDVFVHMSVLNEAAIPFLDDGTRVSYELAQDKGRPSAVGVLFLESESDN